MSSSAISAGVFTKFVVGVVVSRWIH